ncbi:MAG: AAA family ATPase [Pseudomonadales bacterium]
MITLTIASQKGGVGKSTLALSLAVASPLVTCVLDLDPQASASLWFERRESEAPAVIGCLPAMLSQRLDQVKESGAELTIIDTSPVARDVAVDASDHSDLTLIPCRPEVMDFESARETVKVLQKFERRYAVVLNQVPPMGGPETRDVLEAFNVISANVCPVLIHQRKAHGRAQKYGQTAGEFEPESKAATEISALLDYVMENIHAKE